MALVDLLEDVGDPHLRARGGVDPAVLREQPRRVGMPVRPGELTREEQLVQGPDIGLNMPAGGGAEPQLHMVPDRHRRLHSGGAGIQDSVHA